jgi:lipoate-protein ligase A
VEASAVVLHGTVTEAGSGRAVRVCEVTGPALVLGSTQADEDVDAAAAARAGLEVVRRRSGGGAVLVEPGHLVWVDVVLPAGDPLWEVDVGRAFWWLGRAWAGALAAVGVTGAVVHRGGVVASPWSRLVCFAGLGPGEVTLAGRKVVGMAQRRTRHAALFQCAVPLHWDPARLLAVLALDPAERAAAAAHLGDAVHPLRGVPPADLVGALVDHLP